MERQNCPACGGALRFMGKLGLLEHTQCHDCDLTFKKRWRDDDAKFEETQLTWYKPEEDNGTS